MLCRKIRLYNVGIPQKIPVKENAMKTYLEKFFKEFDYPAEARQTLTDAYKKIYASPESAAIFDGILKDYEQKREIKFSEMKDGLEEVAKATGVHDYTVNLLIHICLSKALRG